jgi:hypothetical protein
VSDIIQTAGAGIRLAIFFGCSGAIFALGIIAVSRWLKWAPINITVNVNNYGESEEQK